MGTSSLASLTVKCDCVVGKSGAIGQMINEMIALNLSINSMETATRSKGRVIKGETIKRHMVRCLRSVRPAPNPVAVAKVANNRSGTRNGGPSKEVRDLAKMVQQKAIEGLESGDLKVTVKDGLAATNLLDKRDARLDDQKFILGLARLLSGAGHAGPSEDGGPTIIDVTPSNPLLAPPNMRSDD